MTTKTPLISICLLGVCVACMAIFGGCSSKKKKDEEDKQAPVVEQSVEELIELARLGTVRLSVLDDEGEEFKIGSGFYINDQGHVCTNYHVIRDADFVVVVTGKGRRHPVKRVVACDPKGDLAILELETLPADMQPLQLGVEAELSSGQDVVAIGHPRGFDASASDGIVSAIRATREMPNRFQEFLRSENDFRWIQTTAAISGGNSGGPLLNQFGQVIGVNTWVAAGENLGFAAHVENVQQLADRPFAEDVKVNELTTKLLELQLAPFAEKFEASLEQCQNMAWSPSNLEGCVTIEDAIAGALFDEMFREEENRKGFLDRVGAELAKTEWYLNEQLRLLHAQMDANLRSGKSRPVIFVGHVVDFLRPHGEFALVERLFDQETFRVSFTDQVAFGPLSKGGEFVFVGLIHEPLESSGSPFFASEPEIEISRSVWIDPTKQTFEFQMGFIGARIDRDKTYDPHSLAVLEALEPQMRYLAPEPGVPTKWEKYRLNGARIGFDMIRVKVPDVAQHEMLWVCLTPEGSLGQWYCRSKSRKTQGFTDFSPMTQPQIEGQEMTGYNQEGFVQRLAAPRLDPGDELLIWFRFNTEEAAESYIKLGFFPRPNWHSPVTALKQLDAWGPDDNLFFREVYRWEEMHNAAVIANQAREVAHWVLERGGEIEILDESRRNVVIRRTDDYPEYSFQLVGVDLRRASVIGESELEKLAGISTLLSIDLESQQVASEGLAQITDLPILERLNLSGTQIDDQAIEAITRFPKLRELRIANTHVSNQHLAKLAELELLVHLDLRQTKIDGESLEVLATLPKLETLILAETNISTHELATLSPLTKLVTLDLYGLEFDEASVEQLKDFKSLRFVRVKDSQVDEATKEKLKSDLPGVELLVNP